MTETDTELYAKIDSLATLGMLFVEEQKDMHKFDKIIFKSYSCHTIQACDIFTGNNWLPATQSE